MGRAVECPLCHSFDVKVEQVRFTHDLWSSVPLLSVETMLAFVCKNCKHVQLVHLSRDGFRPDRISVN
jgi:predicted nucleic-acid-binding Zn-ribbon protein